MIKITILPATAKDSASSPSIFKNYRPINKKKIINAPDARVACRERISPPIFDCNDAKTGTLPTISITANNVKVIVMISLTAISPNVMMLIYSAKIAGAGKVYSGYS